MQRRSAARTIILGGLCAGTLDGLAAVINVLAVGGKHPDRIFNYIASGVFGESAISGNELMALWGVLFHYLIATGWTALFFFAYPALARLSRNRVVNGLVYGIVVWVGMNLIVVPLSNVPNGAFKWPKTPLPVAILMVCVGLPISFIVDRHYAGSRRSAAPAGA
jgi:hypothetical protein